MLLGCFSAWSSTVYWVHHERQKKTCHSSQKGAGWSSPWKGGPKEWAGGQQVQGLESYRRQAACLVLHCEHTQQPLSMTYSGTLSLLINSAPKPCPGHRIHTAPREGGALVPRLRPWAPVPLLPPLQDLDGYFVFQSHFFCSLIMLFKNSSYVILMSIIDVSKEEILV